MNAPIYVDSVQDWAKKRELVESVLAEDAFPGGLDGLFKDYYFSQSMDLADELGGHGTRPLVSGDVPLVASALGLQTLLYVPEQFESESLDNLAQRRPATTNGCDGVPIIDETIATLANGLNVLTKAGDRVRDRKPAILGYGNRQFVLAHQPTITVVAPIPLTTNAPRRPATFSVNLPAGLGGFTSPRPNRVPDITLTPPAAIRTSSEGMRPLSGLLDLTEDISRGAIAILKSNGKTTLNTAGLYALVLAFEAGVVSKATKEPLRLEVHRRTTLTPEDRDRTAALIARLNKHKQKVAITNIG